MQIYTKNELEFIQRTLDYNVLESSHYSSGLPRMSHVLSKIKQTPSIKQLPQKELMPSDYTRDPSSNSLVQSSYNVNQQQTDTEIASPTLSLPHSFLEGYKPFFFGLSLDQQQALKEIDSHFLLSKYLELHPDKSKSLLDTINKNLGRELFPLHLIDSANNRHKRNNLARKYGIF